MRKILIISVLAASLSGSATTFAQDIIVLKNGNDIESIVQEVGIDEIKYKKFENKSGPTYTLKKSDIFMIRYENGSKDVFSEITTTPEPKPSPESAPPVVENKQNSPKPIEPLSFESLSLDGVKIFNTDGRLLSKDEVRNIMKTTPNALTLYNKGNSQRAAGWVFIGVSGICLVGSVVQLAAGSSAEDSNLLLSSLYWDVAAIAVVIPAAILLHSGSKNIKESVGAYNREMRKNNTAATLNFGITNQGKIGFVLNF